MDDRSAIVAVATDYWEGWFAGDAGRMERALHPTLAKTGHVVDASGRPLLDQMTADQMIGWTREGEGIARRPADFRYEIVVNDLYREIASVTVSSAIYREYLHLAKTAGQWRIVHALYTPVG
jgi:hypothetical protein